MSILRYWRKLQRRTDMNTLWPACKEHAKSLDHARVAFYAHASNDTAWTKDYTADELMDFISQLK
jgi:hypothetical protein